MKLFNLAFFLLFIQLITAQSKFIIQIRDKESLPVIGAYGSIFNVKDTNQKYYQVSDTAGLLVFSVKASQQYKLTVEYVGYKTYQTILNPGSKNKLLIILSEDAQSLNGVTVVASRPLLRQEEDKTIVDPEVLAGSSVNAYEMMEKIPGVFVDGDGNIYLNGTQQSTIYINGREQKLSSADIATMLKNLSPSSIEKIEIIRTASAKYDAATGGGIVNIILKKGIKIGRTGNLNISANQGKYGLASVGLTINDHNGTKSSYFNFNLFTRKAFDEINSTRILSDASQLKQHNYTLNPGNGAFIRYGLGNETKKKIELNYDGWAHYFQGKSIAENNSDLLNGTSSLFQNLNQTTNAQKNLILSQEFTAKKNLDTLGSNLTGSFNYTYQYRTYDQSIHSIFLNAPAALYEGNGDFNANRNNLDAKLDLLKKYPGHFTLEAGWKTSIQFFTNKVNFFDQINSQEVFNAKRSNQYNYHEGIHAAYVQTTKTFGSFILKTGLRAENTNMYGHQLTGMDTTFKINRTDLFPYVYFSKGLMKIANYDIRAFIIGRRTITRPVYDYLNPGVQYLEQFLYQTGNPGLRPQFMNTYEFNISARDYPIFAIGRNYIHDIFTNVVYQDKTDPNISVRTFDNIGNNRETYLRLLGALPPGGKYFFVVSGQYSLNDYTGLYENKPIQFKRGTWTIFTMHEIKLDPISKLQLGGFIRTKGQQQFYELGDFGSMFANISRYFMDKKLQITLNAQDIFYTNKNTFAINQGNIHAFGNRRSDTRRVGFNLRYSFGLKKKEESNNPFNIDTNVN